MAYPVSRLGDTSDHGGAIVTATGSKVGGVLIARIGDILDCPQHGRNPIVSSIVISNNGGIPVAHIGSKTACGATITTGCATYTIGD